MIQSPAGYQGDVRVKRYLDFYQAGYGVAMLSSGVAFSPLSLFAQGEQGGWYDPSDLTTLFQDAAGTTPVTAVEQPVGLVLDKSKGLALGSELVTNGDFSNGTTGWTLYKIDNSGTESVAVVGGSLQITFPSSSPSNYCQFTSDAFTTVVGKTYKITATPPIIVSGSTTVLAGVRKSDTTLPGSNLVNIVGFDTGVAFGSGIGYFVATSTSTRILFQVNRPASGTLVVSFDNISVRELPGSHLSQSTSTARPVLSARVNLLSRTEEFDNAAWSKNNISPFGSGSVVDATTSPIGTNTADLIRENNTSGEHYVSQQATKPGASIQYTLVCSVKRATAGTRNFGLGITDGTTGGYAAVFNPDTGAVVLASQGIGTTTGWSIATPSPGVNQGNGWWQFSITVTTNTSTRVDGVLYLFDGTTRTYIGDNTSNMYIWGADLRPANAGVGLPSYQRVTTSTDYDTTGFPLYLKFDGTDDSLSSAAIDFTSTDKMSVFAGMRKLSDAALGMVTELSVALGSNNGSFYLVAPSGGSGNDYSFVSKGTASAGAGSGASYVSPITNVVAGLGNISGDSTLLRINGVEVGTNSADQGTGNFGNYPLYVGSRAGSSLRFNGQLYSLIIRGALTGAATIASTETWVNGKTKAY